RALGNQGRRRIREGDGPGNLEVFRDDIHVDFVIERLDAVGGRRFDGTGLMFGVQDEIDDGPNLIVVQGRLVGGHAQVRDAVLRVTNHVPGAVAGLPDTVEHALRVATL